MVKRKSISNDDIPVVSSPTTTTTLTTSSSSSSSRSSKKSTTNIPKSASKETVPPIKIRRIELIEELKDAWNSAIQKAIKGRPKDEQTTLQTVYPILNKQIFNSLNKYIVQDDELGKFSLLFNSILMDYDN